MSAHFYSPAEIETLITMVSADIPTEVIAKVMKRSTVSVRVRVSKLRAEGRLDRLAGRPAPQAAGPQAASDPGIKLSNDAILVRNCRAEGGFPQAVTLDGRTFWITPEGRQWEHLRSQPQKVAA